MTIQGWTCTECGKIFDLLDAYDANEFYYGHDCEEPEVDGPVDGPDPDAQLEEYHWRLSAS